MPTAPGGALSKPLLTKQDSIKYDPDTMLSVPQTAIYMVYLVVFMDILATSISFPALPYFAREFGANGQEIGYLFAAWSFTSTFCATSLGRLSDRIGRRKVLIMSLCGAGFANIGQSFAGSYYELLAWRAFSGVWAAVGSTAQVYVTDVCGTEEVRSEIMGKLAAVPGMALIFGPGIGGGLSKFGLNFPVRLDGCLSIACAILVSIYLPESPMWAKKKDPVPGEVEEKPVINPIPKTVYVLGVSAFLFGMAFGTRVSMMAVSLQAKFDWDPLQVGYLMMSLAVAGVCQTWWVNQRLVKRFGVFPTTTVMTLVNGLFMYLAFDATSDWHWCCFFIFLSNIGFGCRLSLTGVITSKFCDKTNRGTVFATSQMFLNFGRMVGPVVAGGLSVADPIVMPWLFSLVACVLSMVVLPIVAKYEPQQDAAQDDAEKPRARGFSDLEQASQTKKPPTEEEMRKVGQYVCGLLEDRNYPWRTHQDAVLRIISDLLPELREGASDKLADLDKIAHHAYRMQNDMGMPGNTFHQ